MIRTRRSGTGRRASTAASSSSSKRLTGASRPAATISGAADRVAAGGEERVDAVVDGGHPLGAEAEVDQLLAGRLRRRDHLGAPVERRGQAGLEQPPGAGERTGHDLVPHRSVDVVEDRDARPPVPDRREPRDAVPDLDERRRAPHPAGELGHRGAGEHAVAAPPADHVVAVATGLSRQPDARRRAMDDVQPGRRPAAHELVGVDLGSAGVGIVEVTPGQHVDPPNARAATMSADQLVDRVACGATGSCTAAIARNGSGAAGSVHRSPATASPAARRHATTIPFSDAERPSTSSLRRRASARCSSPTTCPGLPAERGPPWSPSPRDASPPAAPDGARRHGGRRRSSTP